VDPVRARGGIRTLTAAEKGTSPLELWRSHLHLDNEEIADLLDTRKPKGEPISASGGLTIDERDRESVDPSGESGLPVASTVQDDLASRLANPHYEHVGRPERSRIRIVEGRKRLQGERDLRRSAVHAVADQHDRARVPTFPVKAF
jgi:hypothetical protein